VTPNRPDWLGVVGIARDLGAKGLGKFKLEPVKAIKGTFPSPVKVRIEDESACPVFAGRLIRGVKNKPSPDWMQKRLKAIGINPKNMLVDVTNYISFDRCRPLHVYDAAKLKGDVRARLGTAQDSFVGLDGKTHSNLSEMCVIADDSGAIGLGGRDGWGEHGLLHRHHRCVHRERVFRRQPHGADGARDGDHLGCAVPQRARDRSAFVRGRDRAGDEADP
jgi:phenylalanyl-tRNA synthetase beta chain